MARNIGLGVLAFAGMRAAYLNVARVVAADPFAQLKAGSQAGLMGVEGVRLQDVQLKAYKAGKLVTSAHIDRVDVSRDRQTFTLNGIRDGFYDGGKSKYRYEATLGYWRAIPKQLLISAGAHVWTPKMNLRTTALAFDEPHHTMNSQSPITGTFYGGKVSVQTFNMDTQTEDFAMGAGTFDGRLTMLQKETGESDPQADRKWNVTCDNSKYESAISTQFIYHGQADDGEILIKANLIERNEKTDVLVATGNVQYFSGKADIMADKATIYHKERRVVLVGHVTMYVKPKADEDKAPVVEPIPLMKRMKPEEVTAGKLSTPTELTAPTPGGMAGKSSQSSSLPSKPTSANPPGQTSGSNAPPAGQTSSPGQMPPAGQTPSAGQPTKPQPVKPTEAKKQSDAPLTPEQKQLDEDVRSGKTARKYPMIIVCDQIEYWYKKGERHGHFTGKPQGRQSMPQGRWRHVWSDSADYDGEKDELVLLSTPEKIDVLIKNSKGDDFKAQKLILSTKDDEGEDDYAAWKLSGVTSTDSGDDDAGIGKKTDSKAAPAKKPPPSGR